ncbi:hypothetical protein B0J11DRAFT_500303 [Dendryphion nanum]|uniref:BTB domain-containing protein n=1 Tax=Dendryphion nanum TaxID=256645 RepID=A0A9P9EI35_9PLEO|nr:hypothetical protein B0J11DRAFT_500303 [Dendryphion nanum]
MATTKSARVAKTSILSFIESTMVRVVVGEGDNQQTFKVNEDVLCSKSDFFSAELSKKWMDEKKREVKLPEDSPDTFAAWVHWAYTSELAITSRDTKDNKWTAQEIRDEYDSLCTLYLLADKLLDVSATNAIIIAIFEVSRIKDTESGWHVPPLIVVKMVYDGTTAADPLRRLLVDFWSNK